jgi:hypothetical protein
MKAMKLKSKKIFKLIAITFLFSVQTAFSQEELDENTANPETKAEVSSRSETESVLNTTEVALYNFYRDQASKNIEQILPKGKFGVQVSLKVNTTKLKNDFEIEPIRLPLGGTYVTQNEIKSSGIIDQSFEKIITYVDQVNVIVSIAPGISNKVQELITTSLKSMMLLDTKRGDTISFNELPEAIVTAWTPEPSIDIYKKPAMLLSGYFGVILMLIVVAMFLGFRLVGSSLSKEAQFISSSIREALESSFGMGGMGGMQNNTAITNATNAATTETKEGSSSDFWEKVDIDSIAAFCFDSVSQPLYSPVPSLMVGTFLDHQKSAQLEALIPKSYVNYVGKINIKPNEVQQIFKKYQTEYRRATRSPISKLVFRVEMEKVLELNSQLGNLEKALLLNSLTPLKRANLLRTYSTDAKLELAKASQGITPIEHKKTEVSLMEKVQKYVMTDNMVDQPQSLNYLTSIILQVESFEEDEKMYEKMSTQGDYRGVLLAFDYFNSENWEEFNLQDLALAFCGYSDKFKELLAGKFSGKKQEWVKNFLKKFSQANLEFNSPQVESVHEMIVSKINFIKSQTQTAGEEKNAS